MKCVVTIILAMILAAPLVSAQQQALPVSMPPRPDGEKGLSDAERSSLLLVRQEKKMAKDACRELYRSSNLPVFKNLGDIEERQEDMTIGLLQKFGIEDPVEDTRPGRFSDKSIKKRYKKMLQLGKLSRVNALRVGAEMKEEQILEYERLLAQTSTPAIKNTYQAFLKQAKNHLRHFNTALKRHDYIYRPERLSKDAFEEITNGS